MINDIHQLFWENSDVDKNEILNLSGVHPLKARNIYVYGSRVYLNNKRDSDFDIVLIAGSLLDHTEIKNEKYNIHVHIPNKFKEDLNNYMVYALECFYAPDWAKVQIKDPYLEFSINKNKFKQSILTQSSNTWHHAKYKFLSQDIRRALKTGFHAIKAVQFGIQILETGKISDFSANNDLALDIMGCEFYDWRPFKEKYLPLKIEFEEKFKNL